MHTARDVDVSLLQFLLQNNSTYFLGDTHIHWYIHINKFITFIYYMICKLTIMGNLKKNLVWRSFWFMKSIRATGYLTLVAHSCVTICHLLHCLHLMVKPELDMSMWQGSNKKHPKWVESPHHLDVSNNRDSDTNNERDYISCI